MLPGRHSLNISLMDHMRPQLLALIDLFFFYFKDLFIVCEYTVAVFRQARRRCQISLRVVVSHHMVAGIWTQDLQKSSQCSSPLSHFSSPNSEYSISLVCTFLCKSPFLTPSPGLLKVLLLSLCPTSGSQLLYLPIITNSGQGSSASYIWILVQFWEPS